MTEKFKIAMVGLGDMAESFAMYMTSDQVEIYGCASRNFQKAQAFAEKFSIPHAFESYEEMLNDQKIQGIYISVPNKQHFAYCKKALLAGKHVLCEKAITTNVAELTELITLAESKNLILQEAMTIFNMPLYEKLKEEIATGRFGKLKMIQAPFGSFKTPDPTNRFFDPAQGGGALLDIGTYAVSFLRYFLSGQPELTSSLMIPFKTGVDEQSVSVFQYEDELAVAPLSFQGKMPKVGIVSFTEAYLTISDYPRGVTCHIHFNDGTTEEIVAGESSNALNYEVENFVKSVATKKNHSLSLSKDVISLLTAMSNTWEKQEL